MNYRNTAEVLAVAYAFAQEFFTSTEGNDEDAPVLIQPQTAGRRGLKPELMFVSNQLTNENSTTYRTNQTCID